LDRHDFTGIFIGYTATDHNIVYIDLDSGLVESSYHAQFDKAWYLQDSRPPAAQLLYNLGLKAEDDIESVTDPPTCSDPAPYPPLISHKVSKDSWKLPQCCQHLPLLLCCTAEPCPVAAAATRLVVDSPDSPPRCLRAMAMASAIADEYKIGRESMEMIYMSPNPYHISFDELLDIRCCDLSRHATAGLLSLECDGKVMLAHMTPGTPGAKKPCWWTCICGAWLIKIGEHLIHSIKDARLAFATLHASGCTHVPLLFVHLEIRPDISRRGLPIVSSAPFTQQTHDQLNDQWEFSTVTEHLRRDPLYQLVDDGWVLNVVTRVMELTRGKLIKQPNWDEWLAICN
jgi:hypothetical protein